MFLLFEDCQDTICAPFRGQTGQNIQENVSFEKISINM